MQISANYCCTMQKPMANNLTFVNGQIHMKTFTIGEFLSSYEYITYKGLVNDADTGKDIDVYITNRRVIWSKADGIGSYLLKPVVQYGIIDGAEYYDFSRDDLGNGSFGIYFGEPYNRQAIWFSTAEERNAFYSELSKVILSM